MSNMTDNDTDSSHSLPPAKRAELVAVLPYESWDDIPDVVQNNLEAPNTDIDGFIDDQRAKNTHYGK